jgi:hypothetical protein
VTAACLDPEGCISLLSKVLRDRPKLENAACVGRWPGLWDPPARGESYDHPDVQYRHNLALEICKSCPVIRECGSAVDALPVSKRPSGVIAGRFTSPSRTGAAA